MPCLSGIGYTAAAKLHLAAVTDAALLARVTAVAVVGINTLAAIRNAQKQFSIADRAMGQQEELIGYAQGTFWPRETELLNAVSDAQPVDSEAMLASRIARRMTPALSAAFNDKMVKARRCRSRYCTGAYKAAMLELANAKREVLANALVLARKMAFLEFQAREDVDWKKRQQLLGLGRGLMSEAAALYGAAGLGMHGIGQAIGTSLSGALQFLGMDEARGAPGVAPAGEQDGYAQAGSVRLSDGSTFDAKGNGFEAPGSAAVADGTVNAQAGFTKFDSHYDDGQGLIQSKAGTSMAERSGNDSAVTNQTDYVVIPPTGGVVYDTNAVMPVPGLVK